MPYNGTHFNYFQPKKMKEKKVSLKDLFVLIVDESGGIFFQEKRKGQ